MSGSEALFESAATLSMEGDFPASFDTTPSLVKSGVDLGGMLTHPDLGAPERWLYAWDDFMGSVDLGTLAPGESVTIDYEARTFVIAGVDKCADSDCAARASIGDPFDVHDNIANDAQSSIGGPGTIFIVPEPETLPLFALSVVALGLFRPRPLHADAD